MFKDKLKDRYAAADKSMTVKKSNVFMLALLLPLYIACVAVYLFNYDYANIFTTIFKSTFLLEIVILAVGVFVFLGAALLAKAVILSVFAEGGFDSVKFKIIKESQKPYCCLTEPIKVRQYQFALAVYILAAGFAPYLISLLIGDFIFVLASLVCVYFAGADILMLFGLFKTKRGSYVTDFDGLLLYTIYEEIK